MYRVYTKGELKGFDAEATKLILWAQQQGATTKVSNKGHAILRSPDGKKTTAVPRLMKAQNRSAQNTRAGVARLFRK